MNVLGFRRDRRQRNPFAAAPAAATPVPCGRNAHGRPLVQDAAGVRPATDGEMAAPDYDTRIDVDQALAGLAAQAEAEARVRTGTFVSGGGGGRHAHPPWTTAPQPAAPDLPAEEAHRSYNWHITAADNPPAHDRPYIPGVLGSEGRLSPRSAGVSEDLAGLVLFRFSVERMTRPCCERCQQAAGDWRERLYGTFRHHTQPVDAAAPRQFGIATELRQAHEGAAADADDAEAAFARRYLVRRAA